MLENRNTCQDANSSGTRNKYNDNHSNVKHYAKLLTPSKHQRTAERFNASDNSMIN